MPFQNTTLLSSKPLLRFFQQAGFGAAFVNLTSGVYLSGLALLMGAGDVLVSYLSIILNICGVLIFFFSGALERFHSRKKLTVTLTVLSKLATLFIVAIPVLAPHEARLWLFVPTVVVAFTLQAQTTVALNQWMLLFIDARQSGRYISLRQTLVLVVTVILAAAGGWWMDRMEGQYLGFALLFAFAALMGLVEIILLLRTPDGPAYHSSVRRCTLRELVTLPLKNKAFRGFVLYIFLFYLLLYISDSYTMVYMMKYLALPYGTINLLYMIISIPQVFLLGFWGRLSDRRGHQFVLKTSIWLFLGETFFVFFASQKSWFIFIPLAFLVSSAANSGFVISVFNRRYELMPEGNRIVYDNFYTAAVGLAFVIGPMLGGAIKGAVEATGLLVDVLPFANIRLLYLVATLGLLLLQIIYSRTQRKGKNACPESTCTSTPATAATEN